MKENTDIATIAVIEWDKICQPKCKEVPGLEKLKITIQLFEQKNIENSWSNQ